MCCGGAGAAGADQRTVNRTGRSDRTGEATFSAVSTGDCAALVSAPGFKKIKIIGLTIRSEEETLIDAKLQVLSINIDYVDGIGPLPLESVHVRAVDTHGAPILSAHGWVICDAVLQPVLLGEMSFTAVSPYPGIVIAADGFESRLIDPAQVAGDVILR